MAAPFSVEQRGVGKPDYSKEISLGRVRPGLTLKYRQGLIIGGVTFSAMAPLTPYSWMKLPLAPGATSHLVDWATGFDAPYDCLAGYVYSVVTISHSFDQDRAIRVYFSTPALLIPLVFAGNLGTIASGALLWEADILPFSTIMFDQNAAYAHQVDFIVENLGGANMEGSVTITGILEAVGTEPLPTTKTVKCKWCGHEWVVPRETTYIKCPNCGEMNIYADFSRIRSIG